MDNNTATQREPCGQLQREARLAGHAGLQVGEHLASWGIAVTLVPLFQAGGGSTRKNGPNDVKSGTCLLEHTLRARGKTRMQAG